GGMRRLVGQSRGAARLDGNAERVVAALPSAARAVGERVSEFREVHARTWGGRLPRPGHRERRPSRLPPAGWFEQRSEPEEPGLPARGRGLPAHPGPPVQIRVHAERRRQGRVMSTARTAAAVLATAVLALLAAA